jgi:hypothetical protein
VGLVGVYDADGTAVGELSYWIGARFGRAHCSLCEITHGLLRVKQAWTTCRLALPVEFETFHRNDMPDPVRIALDRPLPAVLGELADGSIVPLLGRDELDACDGSIDALLLALESAATSRGLSLDLGLETP